ncbi:hypothetical protein, partial [Martelella alba]|uniref:hypothetical protein n=1 Tax=Martelella alba TaxID=2590451 RepID=UPI0015E85538
SSSGGLISGLDVDMEGGTGDTLVVEGDFAGSWGVDVHAATLLPNTRADFLKVEGTDLSDITVLSSLIYDFTDVTTDSDGWAGFSVDSAHFTDTGLSLGKNASEVSRGLQEVWDRLSAGETASATASDEITIGQIFGSFQQSTNDSLSDDLQKLASQTAAAGVALSPASAIAAANSVLSCPAFEGDGIMLTDGSCVWAKGLGGSTIQQPTGDQYGFTRSMGG